jgi:hypothetical protein
VNTGPDLLLKAQGKDGKKPDHWNEELETDNQGSRISENDLEKQRFWELDLWTVGTNLMSYQNFGTEL